MPVKKPPKCLICKSPTELITCHCQDQPQQKYFCWTCKRHYPLEIINQKKLSQCKFSRRT